MLLFTDCIPLLAKMPKIGFALVHLVVLHLSAPLVPPTAQVENVATHRDCCVHQGYLQWMHVACVCSQWHFALTMLMVS